MEPTDYFSCGFFLIRADKPEWEQLQSELFPEGLLSLSRCICPRFGLYWGWKPTDQEAAVSFGIPESQWDEFLLWCQSAHQREIDFPSMFHTLAAAQTFAQSFNLNVDEVFLVEVGLHHELEQSNWQFPSGETEYGIEKRVGQHLPMTAGGTPLGFEVASFAYNDFGHSWLCSGLQSEMFKLYGIRPGQLGLIQSEEDARKVYEWIAEDDLKGQRAEPEPYHYYLLGRHPLYPQSMLDTC